MRILTPEQFLKEPYGVTYIRFIPQTYIGNIEIKTEERGTNSWWATDILPWVIDDEEFDVWENDKSYELKTEGFTTDDATYNHDSNILYVVFNEDEVGNMIERLKSSFKTYTYK